MRRRPHALVVRALSPLVVVLSSALVLTGAPVLQGLPSAVAADADDSPTSASTASSDAATRPDAVSAMVTARVSGHRVEDLSQRTESSQTFANPDGTWSTEAATQPEFVQDDTGAWHDIDTTLVDHDGQLTPKYALTDLSLPAQASSAGSTFASLHQDGKELDWHWPTKLPAPSVDGATATYHDVVPGGGDLVVTATATGFTHDIVLDQAPAAAVADPTGQVSWTVPVATHGADLEATTGGGLAISKADGTTLATAPAPVAYDADVDPDQGLDPATDDTGTAPVDVSVGENAADTPTMTLSADSSFLTDADTTYPVTIDPTFTMAGDGDGWVTSGNPAQAHGDDGWLDVGDAGDHVARAFLHFGDPAVSLVGKDIISAKLQLRNYYSSSCTAATILAQRVTESWSAGSTTWNNQPAATTTGQAGFSPAFGYSSACATDWANWDVTDIVSYWAAHSGSNHGIRLKANDETNPNSWRQYRSLETTVGDYYVPKMTVTYNTVPNKPGTPTISTSPASNTGYSTSATPTLKATVSDPDKGTVRAKFEVLQGSTVAWSGYSSYVSSGGTASVKTGSLANGTYTVKVTANDGTDNSTSSSTASMTVDTTKPAVAVTSTGFTDSQWAQDAPSSNSFTFDGPSDTKSFTYSEDGVVQPTKSANASGDATISWLPKDGAHKLYVTATDKAGNTGPAATFSFGVGQAKFDDLGDAPQSTGTFPIHIEGPPGASSVDLSWRYAGDSTSAWNSLTGVTTTSGDDWSSTNLDTDADTGASATPNLLWDATEQNDPNSASADNITAPALLQLRACFHYTTGTAQICSVTQQLQLVPSAFGGNFPTTNLGPTTVALYTGEASYDEMDAVDAQANVGRSFSSFDAATAQPGPFGPGWSTDLEASADSTAELIDDRAKDHTFVLVTAGGSSQIFTPVDGGVDPTNPTGTVVFEPAGVDDGHRLTLSADGATATLTQLQGDTTIWTRASDGAWNLSSADSSMSQSGTTATVDYDSAGYPAWIAETDPGDSAACTPTEQEAGCRGLSFHYTGTGAETRVDHIDLVTPNTTSRVATYTYDADGRLQNVCGADPDASGPQSALCTSYDYDTTTVPGRTLLAGLTPPGEAAWTLTYDAAGRLTGVSRSLPNGSGTATWSVDYHLSVTDDGLPDLSSEATQGWGQTASPTRVIAVFDPEHAVTSTPTRDDLDYADLWYTDANGNTTNTAMHGNTTQPDGTTTSGWLIDADWYDEHGNVVQSLDAAGLQAAKAAGTVDDEIATAIAHSSYTVYSSDGTRVEDEYGPVHAATVADGTTGEYRSHNAYVYDDEAPDLGGAAAKPDYPSGQASFNLIVETDTSSSDPEMTTDYDVQRLRENYAPLVDGDANGWTLGIPTQSSVEQPDGTWAVTAASRYDADGNQIESREPGGATNADGSGSDAHTSITTYYAKNSPDSDCDITGHDDRAGWEGLECKVGPAKQPEGAPIPVTWIRAYNADLQPTLSVEISAGTTRTTTLAYDALDRLTKTSVDDGQDTREQNYTYDTSTGLESGIDNADGHVTQTYDDWGQVETYADSSGLVTTTTYTPDGDIASVTNADGTTTYDYDSTGSNDSVENRGLLTSITTTTSKTETSKFTFKYDADGNRTRVEYPNGMTSAYSYDETGAPTGLTYTAADGTDLLDFTDTLDVEGNIVQDDSPESSQAYTYDGLHRLTQVQDVRETGCTTRDYTFSANSERTGLTTFDAADDGGCQTTTATSHSASSYDAASRITDAGYTYDNLGRTLTVPSADTDAATDTNAGSLTVGYYANDMVKSLAQTVSSPNGGTERRTTAYQLDATGRITTTTNATDGAETSRQTNQYADDTDAPAVTRSSSDNGNTWVTTRYLNDDALGLLASITGDTITYQLSNLDGDIVATTSDTTSLGIDSYAETDEYGNPIDNPAGPYNWLGASQRASGTVGGLVLMGARLYNPRTGTFLTRDPVPDGNANPYNYPVDPVNMIDPSGQFSIGHMVSSVVHKVGHVLKGAAVWAINKGLVKIGVKLICAEEGGVVCQAAVAAVAAFTTTLLKDVFINGMHVKDSIHPAIRSAEKAFVSTMIGTPLKAKNANRLIKLIRSFGTKAANYLNKLGHTTTAKGVTTGMNLLANYIGGWV